MTLLGDLHVDTTQHKHLELILLWTVSSRGGNSKHFGRTHLFTQGTCHVYVDRLDLSPLVWLVDDAEWELQNIEAVSALEIGLLIATMMPILVFIFASRDISTWMVLRYSVLRGIGSQKYECTLSSGRPEIFPSRSACTARPWC